MNDERRGKTMAIDSSRFRWPLPLTAASALALVSCAKVNLEWSEEVRLADGHVVVVERTAQGEKHAELGGPKGWKQTEMTMTFPRMSGNIKAPPEWRDTYVPILLDYQPSTDSWSLVATFTFCETWYELGRPVPPYIEYQSTSGAPWRQVPLEERFIDRKTNVLTGPRSDGEPDLVTIADKEVSQLRAAPKYSRILRRWGREEANYCDPS